MKELLVVVRNYTTKDGRPFQKITTKGKFAKDVKGVWDDEQEYTVRLTGKPAPTCDDGSYIIGYEKGGAWVDNRPEFADKFIIRVRAKGLKLNKKFDKVSK